MSPEPPPDAPSPYHSDRPLTGWRGRLIWLPALVFGGLLIAGLMALGLARGSQPPAPLISHSAELSAQPGAPTLVDLNHATRAELEALPGIGRGTAESIIERRSRAPIRSLRELVAAGVLSEAQYEQLAPFVTLTIRQAAP